MFDAAGAAAVVPVVPKRLGVVLVVLNENGDAVDVAGWVPKPPNIGAAVDVVAAGVPKIFVAVDEVAGVPKPVNAGVVVAAPNTGAAVLVLVPKIFVDGAGVPKGFVIAGAALVVEVGAPKILVVVVGAVEPNGVEVAG